MTSFTLYAIDYDYPEYLSEVTTQSHIDWMATYGRGFLERQRALEGRNPETDAYKLEQTVLTVDTWTSAIANWSGAPLLQVREGLPLVTVMELVRASYVSWRLDEAYLPVPESVVLGETEYVFSDPTTGIPLDTVEHDEYMACIQLCRYITELMDDDYTHMKEVLAAFLRLPGEVLTPELIATAGGRVPIFRDLAADKGLAVTQYARRNFTGLLAVVNRYTADQMDLI